MPSLRSKQEGAEGETEAEKGRFFSLRGPWIWALGLKLRS